MAQLVERTLGKGEVPSSTLGISTIEDETRRKAGFFMGFYPHIFALTSWLNLNVDHVAHKVHG